MYIVANAKIADSQLLLLINYIFFVFYQLDPLVVQWNFVADNSKLILSISNVNLCFFCLVFAMSLCTSVYMCFVVTGWERAGLLAIVCGVLL